MCVACSDWLSHLRSLSRSPFTAHAPRVFLLLLQSSYMLTFIGDKNRSLLKQQMLKLLFFLRFFHSAFMGFSAQGSLCLLTLYLLLHLVFLWLTICIWFEMRWQYVAHIDLNLNDAEAFIFIPAMDATARIFLSAVPCVTLTRNIASIHRKRWAPWTFTAFQVIGICGTPSTVFALRLLFPNNAKCGEI